MLLRGDRRKKNCIECYTGQLPVKTKWVGQEEEEGQEGEGVEAGLSEWEGEEQEKGVLVAEEEAVIEKRSR
jgi:hypothetical protein